MGFEREEDQVWLRQRLSGRPSLIISIWFSKPIVSKVFGLVGNSEVFTFASGDCSHLNGSSLFESSSIHVKCVGVLIIHEDWVVTEDGPNELTSVE